VRSNCTFDRGSLCPTYSKPFDLFVKGNKSGDWRRGWDSNPRALSDKTLSRRPRYDHFGTSPSVCSAKRALHYSPRHGPSSWPALARTPVCCLRPTPAASAQSRWRDERAPAEPGRYSGTEMRSTVAAGRTPASARGTRFPRSRRRSRNGDCGQAARRHAPWRSRRRCAARQRRIRAAKSARAPVRRRTSGRARP
jgi:hypothetical protein